MARTPAPSEVPELTRTVLFASESFELADVRCRGTCKHRSPEESQRAAQLIYPYRGAFLRHLGNQAMLADANQVLCFSTGEAHQVSHPVPGGDACLVLTLSAPVLEALAPTGGVDAHAEGFALTHRTLAPETQLRRAGLFVRLMRGEATPLEADEELLALARESLEDVPQPKRRPTRATKQLVERVKLRLAEADVGRLSLADLGRDVGVSPVYLTQVFRDLEGVPLYRYQLRLRLAQALDRLPDADDLAALALDLGFASHSQFTARFRETYGQPPSRLRRAKRR
jgi:AraC-like DNA-binding protein